MQNKKKNTKLKKKGVSLIVLVITIIVMVILAAAVIVSLNNTSILDKAQQAVDKTNENEQQTASIIESLWNLITGSGNTPVTPPPASEPVTNPYEDEEWTMAWTCTNEVWSDTTYLQGDTLPEDVDITAKLYPTGEVLTSIPTINYGGQIFDFNSKDEEESPTAFRLVIEGTGAMGSLLTTVYVEGTGWVPTGASAWQTATLAAMSGGAVMPIIPYVTEIIICDGITNIPERAFFIDASLVNVTISNTVTNIGSQSFCYCKSMQNISLPNSVANIGDSSFYSCIGLTSITIPSSVTSVGGYAFKECTGLTSITIENSVISTGMFKGCTGLTSVTIPSSVTSVGEISFGECTGLTNVNIQSSIIGDSMFERCTKLSNVTMSNSVTSIGSGAFFGCTGITSVTIPSSVTSIGDSAFKECAGLTSITIPSSVTSIGDSAFEDCTGLTSVTIPSSVTSVGDYAFGDCTGLTSVTIENNVIGKSMFGGYTNLKTVNITATDATAFTIEEGATYAGLYISTLGALKAGSKIYVENINMKAKIESQDGENNYIYIAPSKTEVIVRTH